MVEIPIDVSVQACHLAIAAKIENSRMRSSRSNVEK